MKITLTSQRPGHIFVLSAALSLFLAAHPLSYAQLASDEASNYTTWTSGSNEGSGFGEWTLSDGGPGSFFLATSSEGGPRTNSIDSGGVAFGMWNAGGTTEAIRGFGAGVWQDGASLSFDFSFRFDDGVRGVTANSDSGEIFSLGISTTGYAWTAGLGAPQTEWTGQREFGEIISLTLTQNGSNVDFAFSGIHASSPSESGSVAGTLDTFRIFSAAGSGGGGNDVFANNFQVIPEPSTYAALFGLGALAVVLLRRRQKSN